MRQLVVVVLALFSFSLCACGATTTPARGPSSISYRIALDATLTRMEVEVCPGAGERLPTALVPIHDAARARLVRAELSVRGVPERTLIVGDEVSLRDAPAGACARYVVDLGPGSIGQSTSEPAHVGEDLFAPSSAWLLAPSPRDPGARYRARFELPEGVSMSPFWPRDDEGLWFDERAFAFVTYAAFGRFDVASLGVPGGCVDVITLDGALRADRADLDSWVSAAAGASAHVTGRFPADHATWLVIPGPPFPEMPVIFGVAGRGVRPSVSLLVSSEATRAQLVPDWTAVHELSHLLTPYVSGEDVWLSEGLATYYEEVLRARAGLITPEAAWRALDQGFRRGAAEAGANTLRQECALMHANHSYTRVYWGGAAIVFLADVSYRRAGSSLDAAVARAWDRREERMTAEELMRAFDGAQGGPFSREAPAALDATSFPSLDAAYAWLGIRREGDECVFDDAAPGASARRALMNDSPPLASIPQDCEAR